MDSTDFKLVVPSHVDIHADPGDDVTLPCHLSVETSVVAMEVKWLKRTDCIYWYKDGQGTEGRDYEGRLSVLTEDLERGDVSLRLRDVTHSESGLYRCQVIHGDLKLEETLWLYVKRIRGTKTSYEEKKRMGDLTPSTRGPGEPMPELRRLTSHSESEQMLDETRQLLKNHQRLLQDKDMELKALVNQMEEKDRVLQERTTDLEGLNRQLVSLEKVLNEKNRRLHFFRNQLQEKDKELKETERQLEKMMMKSDHNISVGLKSPVQRNDSSQFLKPDLGDTSEVEAPQSAAVSDLRLVLLGRDTAETKTTRDTILGKGVLVNGADSSTGDPCSESTVGRVAGRQVTVVLTPDWFSPEVCQVTLREDVKLCMQLSAPGPHAFILVIPVTPAGTTEEARAMAEDVEKVFAETCWKHTLILFTCRVELTQENMEGQLPMACKELVEVVKRSGHRWHLLTVNGKNSSTQVEGLMKKVEKMVESNSESFYSSETYLEAETQLREMERMIQREREERKEKEEKERMEQLERELQECVKVMEEKIQEKDEKIEVLEVKISSLEKELEEERNVERRLELERQLKDELEQRAEAERERDRLREEMEREKREKEETHRQEMEEIQENYEREALAEAERNLMKIILPELQKNLKLSNARMQSEFCRQLEEKNSEIRRLRQMLTLEETLRLDRERHRGAGQALLAVLNATRRYASRWLLQNTLYV